MFLVIPFINDVDGRTGVQEGELPEAPWYDASPLRGGKEKLGLGSSAAICVASLGALVAAGDLSLVELLAET